MLIVQVIVVSKKPSSKLNMFLLSSHGGLVRWGVTFSFSRLKRLKQMNGGSNPSMGELICIVFLNKKEMMIYEVASP